MGMGGGKGGETVMAQVTGNRELKGKGDIGTGKVRLPTEEGATGG